jgi:hypothetical protein
MSHHDGMNDEYMKEVVKKFNLGATGQFPLGKLTPFDEGELRIAIGEEKGKVVITLERKLLGLALLPNKQGIWEKPL